MKRLNRHKEYYWAIQIGNNRGKPYFMIRDAKRTRPEEGWIVTTPALFSSKKEAQSQCQHKYHYPVRVKVETTKLIRTRDLD